MGKTRSCRRTDDQAKIHEKAVKMRKMTDEQLVHYVEDRVAKAKSEGFNQGKAHGTELKQERTEADASELVEGLAEAIGQIRGIGAARLQDIRRILEAHLEVAADG